VTRSPNLGMSNAPHRHTMFGGSSQARKLNTRGIVPSLRSTGGMKSNAASRAIQQVGFAADNVSTMSMSSSFTSLHSRKGDSGKRRNSDSGVGRVRSSNSVTSSNGSFTKDEPQVYCTCRSLPTGSRPASVHRFLPAGSRPASVHRSLPAGSRPASVHRSLPAGSRPASMHRSPSSRPFRSTHTHTLSLSLFLSPPLPL
jgi:hypothetical protein